MNTHIRTVVAFLLAALLTSCATKGTWMLAVGRTGKCRMIEHRANSDQLTTSTSWRGEGCAAKSDDLQNSDQAEP